MNKNVDVCVIGAGPGGALLSSLLAKSGVSVALLEKQTMLGRAFRGEILNSDGIAVLKKHEVMSRLADGACLPLEHIEYWLNGKLVKMLLPDKSEGNVGIHVPQADLLDALIKEAEQYSNFTLHTGVTVSDLVQDAHGYYNGIFATDGKGDEVLLHSRVIVGADGRYSTVRRHANIPAMNRNHGYDLLWARIPAPSGWKPIIRSAIVDNQQLHLFTQARGYIQIGWNIEQDSYPKLRKQSFEPFITTLIQAFPDLEHQVRQYIKSWNDFVLLDIFSSQVDTWTKDGLVLIGDAAHTMTPTGAFGLNEALRDADWLANHLTEGLQRESLNVDCLKQLEQVRRHTVEELQQEQLMMEQNYKQNFYVG
ncbi:FAD-dependent monooxygenase [Paenibacillus senegalimassiliensis]|uniref:FAD-dependent monooxygenase n=1 Tax=Paenibacillus senegalimassiliensis TaxID=1737426 RepID=UPI00073F11D5|nr:FAD-dependent monooxygenase [Paenibacillus senegalimassiliensis]